MLAAAIVGGASLAKSSLFAVDGIDIVGTRLLHKDQILSVSGLHLGMNVLSIDTSSVRSKLQALPLVSSVDVKRVYPSKIRIVVREKRIAAMARVGGVGWLVDDAGRLIEQVAEAPRGVPAVAVSAQAGSQALTEALRLWGSLPAWARAKIGMLSATDPLSISARMAGTVVIFGSADDVLSKMEAVVAVFERAKITHRRVSRIDVRSPTRPAAVFAQ